MSNTGYIQVHAYTSNARIPLQNVAIAVNDSSGDTIAFRLTNRSGTLDVPIPIEVPDKVYSQSPNSTLKPYATVNIIARLENYELIENLHVQVFADTITDQNLEMIPLPELPDSYLKAQIFDTPSQSL